MKVSQAIAEIWPAEEWRIFEGIMAGCKDCTPYPEGYELSEKEYDLYREPSFSKTPCDSGGSPLGGNRYKAHAVARGTPDRYKGGSIYHIDICVDCLLYLVRGDNARVTWKEDALQKSIE